MSKIRGIDQPHMPGTGESPLERLEHAHDLANTLGQVYVERRRAAVSVATIGRWAMWLPDVAAGRRIWLAFDANRPGEQNVAEYLLRFPKARVGRLIPPPPSQDWSAALVRRGRAAVANWLRDQTGSSCVIS